MDFPKLKTGDQRAWLDAGEELLATAKAGVRNQCPRLSWDEIDAVAVQALAEVIDQIDELGSEEALHSRLFTCAGRRAIDAVRGKGRPGDILAKAEPFDQVHETVQNPKTKTPPSPSKDSAYLDPSDKPPLSPSEELVYAEQQSIAAEMLDRLTPDDAQLLREAYLLKIPHREIAEKRNWETNTVGNRINQAVKRANKLLSSNEKLKEICAPEK